MSFLNNNRPDRMPGPINSLNGICEKICVHGKKVFDACMKQEQLEAVQFALTDITPDTPTPVMPYTYVGAKTTSSNATVSDLSITPLDPNGCAFRVQCNLTIPVTVYFRDSNGNLYSGTSSLTVTKDVKLSLPKASIMPFEVEATANIVGSSGTYVSDCTFSVNLCVTTVLRIVVECDLLVPSFGYCCIPQCIEYQTEACEGLFDLPLFPQDLNRR